MNPSQDPGVPAPRIPSIGPVRCAQDLGCELGEGPMWSGREQALYWVDILSRRLYRWDLSDAPLQSWDFGEEISALAERARHPGLIVALRRGFALFDPATGAAPRYLHQPEPDQPGNRFNDGRCDAAGRFWAGSMDFACQDPTGALYRYDPDGTCTLHDEGFAVTNGPAWPGGQEGGMFFNDTVQGRTYRYDFDAASGRLSNRTLWKRWSPEEGVPDGMTADAEGRLWIAHWGGSCVTCHDPATAQELARIDLPVSQVTHCAFGGPGLRTLFITSARVGLTPEQLQAQPLAGALFAAQLDVAGLPANLFGG